MKKLLVVLSVMFLSLNTFAQKDGTVNGVKISELGVEYVQILGHSSLLKPNQVKITIDFGQKWFNGLFKKTEDIIIRDSNGEALIFNSMMDALNFMFDNGYEFVNAYIITISNQNVYHYVLKKK